MPRVKECCFCQYAGNERTFRNVGTEDHPEDQICNLCDTETAIASENGLIE